MKINTLGCELSTKEVYFDKLNNINCMLVGPVFDDSASCIVEKFTDDITDEYFLTEWTALQKITLQSNF